MTHGRKTLVEAEALTRYYDERCAVDNISLSLQQGDILGLLGPNGAGKSSTLRMLCGVLAPSAGKILINGIDLLENPQAAKTCVGFLPEQPPLYHELTVDEYLSFCAKLHAVTRSHRPTAIKNAKLRCGLQDSGHRLIRNLSKGFQQRTGIAQAILHSPLLVVLDEPTVGLDPIQILEIRTLIAEIGQQHGVILSTHILDEAQKICTRVQIMHQGRIALNTNLQQLQDNAKTRYILLEFRQAPSPQTLLDIPGIHNATRLGENRLRIEIDPSTNPTETIINRSVQQNWGLIELSPETQSLEQIFLALTQQNNTHPEECAA